MGGGVIFLLALLTSCPGSSDIKIHTDGELLKGQWALYLDSSELELSEEFNNSNYDYLIDIQHTLPGYWIVMGREGGNLDNAALPVKPDRTEENDWFVVESLFGPGTVMKYRLVDDDPNTLEGEIFSDVGTAKCRLERFPSDQEIKLHIVTFKLDASDDGYVFYNTDYEVSSPLLIIVKPGDSLGANFFPGVRKNGTNVGAQFTADGAPFTEDTTVNDDITVIVKLQE